MKVEVTPEAATEWMGMAVQAGNTIMKGANFTLKQMLQRTTSRLDVAESKVRIGYGKHEGRWCWMAVLTDDGNVFVRKHGELVACADDPMHALAELVEKAEE